MRKVFFLLFILMFAISCSNDEDEKADISINSSHIMHNGHEFVDLGLPSGLLWATCNVGAYSAHPINQGDYALSLQKNTTQSHKLQNDQGKTMIAKDSFVPLL